MKYLANVVVTLSLFGTCTSLEKKEKNSFTICKNNSLSTKYIKDISELDNDTNKYIWHGGGIFGMFFEKEKVYFEFNIKCGYWYKTQVLNEKQILFFWDYNENCTFDRGLKEVFISIPNPIIGKPFGKINLVNDTTLQIEYYYTEWVKNVNKNAKDVDTLFPSIFVLRQ